MIQRRKPLARSTKPLKRSPIKRGRVAIASKRSKPRRGPSDIAVDEWRSPGYRHYIRDTGLCVACLQLIRRPDLVPGVRLDQLRPGMYPGACDPAHTENGGMRQKGRDSSCAPLCRGFGTLNHHEEYDRGRKLFEARYQVEMQREAAQKWQEWRIFDPETL